MYIICLSEQSYKSTWIPVSVLTRWLRLNNCLFGNPACIKPASIWICSVRPETPCRYTVFYQEIIYRHKTRYNHLPVANDTSDHVFIVAVSHTTLYSYLGIPTMAWPVSALWPKTWYTPIYHTLPICGQLKVKANRQMHLISIHSWTMIKNATQRSIRSYTDHVIVTC